ncbi:MAG: hypothetical protein L3J74_04815, partial [Bacteroidales bacterium]|nr:hypothetical protein [Bacteroidales bacterium]
NKAMLPGGRLTREEQITVSKARNQCDTGQAEAGGDLAKSGSKLATNPQSKKSIFDFFIKFVAFLKELQNRSELPPNSIFNEN